MTKRAVVKQLLLAGVAGIALVVGAPANAADLGTRPSYQAPPVVVAPAAIAGVTRKIRWMPLGPISRWGSLCPGAKFWRRRR
jgi:hypothetical protein